MYQDQTSNIPFRNVWAFEKLLTFSPRVGMYYLRFSFCSNAFYHTGSTLTFIQMLFITVFNLPSFINWGVFNTPTKIFSADFQLMKSRQVPLSQWALQVIVLTFGSLFNNWAFGYDVPLPLQIIFRSSGPQ